MAYFKDFDFVLESGGAVAGYREEQSTKAAALAPHQGLTLTIPAVSGPLELTVSGLDFRKPSTIKKVGPKTDPKDPDAGIIELFNHVPLLIELFAPGQQKPVATLKTEDKPTENETSTLKHVVGGAGSPEGVWEIQITNRGKTSAKVDATAHYFFDRQSVTATDLPVRLLDHTYTLLLQALLPSAKLSGDKVIIEFGSELVHFFGSSAPAALGRHTIDISPISGTGSLQSVDLEACAGNKLLGAMLERFQQVKAAVDDAAAKAQALPEPSRSALLVALRKKQADNDAFRRHFEDRVKPDFPTIHATAAFSAVDLELDLDEIVPGPLSPLLPSEVHLADIQAVTVHIYLAFNAGADLATALVLAPLKIDGALVKIGQFLGLIPKAQQFIEEKLPPILEAAASPAGRFLAEALARLSGGTRVFLRFSADDNNWHVRHTAVPAEHTFTRPVGTLTTPPPKPVPGRIPAKFIRDESTLKRLDQIKTIVVVMMENRSFDHMLGYLRSERSPKYEGLIGNETNSVKGRTQPVQVRPAAEVVENPVTRIQVSPNHFRNGDGTIDHVDLQINDGKMDGFAQDYEDLTTGSADIAMTFYTSAELKTYDRLAALYKVCDHWFAAHPGPTWPNRWTTFGGTPVKIDNPELNDETLGFITAPTIFDLLDAHGIDWRIFENDLSLIRTYNRYRLNVDKVVPFVNRQHPELSFQRLAEDGKLPPVVFVEPNFSDIPPIATANDDLAPVDLRRGQRFVGDVFRSLSHKPEAWRHTLFLVTYDEHGVFYDHVPPPGTSLGPPEFIGKIPKIHPDGKTHLGVRVPAILASPMVSAGEVSHVVFDHTSIIKTILLRFRDRFGDGEFLMFGDRVAQAAHLGQALDLDVPRDDQPGALQRIAIRPDRTPAQQVFLGHPLPQIPGEDDFHGTLRSAFLPRPIG